MFNFMKSIRAKQTSEAEQRLARWRDLLGRAALKDDLKPAEALELAELHQQIAPDEDLEAMAVAIHRHGDLTPLAAKVDDRTLATKKAEAVVSAFDEETQAIEDKHRKLIEARRTSREKLASAITAARAELDQATAAARERNELADTAWLFFGRTDPRAERARQQAEEAEGAERARLTRYVARFTHENATKYTGYNVLWFELRLDRPDVNDANMPSYIWRPLPGQTREEVDQMAGMLVDAWRKAKCGAFLPYRIIAPRPLPANYQQLGDTVPGIRLWVDEAEASAEAGKLNPSNIKWIIWPGQTERELAAIVSKLEKLYGEHVKKYGRAA